MKLATLQYPAHTSKSGYRQLEQACLAMGLLYNSIIKLQARNPNSDYIEYDRKAAGRHITDLLNNDPKFQGYPHKLADAMEKRAYNALSAHLSYLSNLSKGIVTPKKGKPHTKDIYQNRTLEISEPTTKHLTVSENGKKATIRAKGLPDIHFKPDHRLPAGVQPPKISISLTPKRLLVNLTFNIEDLHRQWPEPTRHSMGVDPGVTHTLSTGDSEDEATHLPQIDYKEHRKTTNRLRRKIQRHRDQALKDGRARWTSRRNRKGKLKHRFRWNNGPSGSYLKTLARLRKVEQSRSDSQKGRLHRFTTELVKTYGIICWEDTQILNLTKSPKGTVENPGKNVAQKSGLNRSISEQGWGMARRMAEYKSDWAGRTFVPVPAAYTSQTCSNCLNVCAASRRTRDQYVCVACGHRQQADENACQNIRRQGVESLDRVEAPSGSEDLCEPPETPKGVITVNGPGQPGTGSCSPERSRQLRLIP